MSWHTRGQLEGPSNPVDFHIRLLTLDASDVCRKSADIRPGPLLRRLGPAPDDSPYERNGKSG